MSVGDTNEKTSSTEFNKIQKFSQNDSSFSVRFYNIKKRKTINQSNMRKNFMIGEKEQEEYFEL